MAAHWAWGVVAVFVLGAMAQAASKDLGNGFADLGVAAPISNHRGTVATVDGQKHNVALLWLMDHRGGYSLLLVDATAGKAEQFPMPFEPAGESVDSPYATILSSANRYYTQICYQLAEFDANTRAFTFHGKASGRFGMGMTEDDKGVIWTAAYPQCGVSSFDPKTKELRNYGDIYAQNWNEYPTSIAADDAGWVYIGIGHTASQIVALEASSGKATPLLSEEQREKGQAYVVADESGKVFGQALKGKGEWVELYKGQRKPAGKSPAMKPKKIVAGNQALWQGMFPDGSKIKSIDLTARKASFVMVDGKEKEFPFEYQSEGAVIETVMSAPDGTICGGTTFPMRFFRYDADKDTLENRAAYGQWNTVDHTPDRYFVGGYPGGFLLEWDPSKPWVPTDQKNPNSNPKYLTQYGEIHRPHRILAHPDGATVIVAGTPEYGHTGGGMLFWDRKEGQVAAKLTDKDLIPDQSTINMLPLPDGKLLCGTTTNPGTGGERKAKVAEAYIMDLASRKVEWHEALLPEVQDYPDFSPARDGLVYGLAGRDKFIVFDPAKKKIVHEQSLEPEIGPVHYHHDARNFIRTPDGATYLIAAKGIAKIDPRTFKVTMVAKSPVNIEGGGDFLGGRIYFIGGSHVYAWRVK